MSGRAIEVRGRSVWLSEDGDGAPLVYLHGLADLHGASAEPLAFHRRLAREFRLIAPAHPGCSRSDEDDGIDGVEDLVFHCLEVLDALGLGRFRLAGADMGGWLAAEIAVRHPERIDALALVGATGLFVPGQPIADIFWESHPADGVSLAGLRALLFGDPDHAVARELFPDGRGEIAQELLRYRTFRLASRIGFNPPYLHHRKLRDRLHRYGGPALVVHGDGDRMVPRSHAEAYRDGFPSARLEIVPDAGHSPHLEKPEPTARVVAGFLSAGG